jgi:MscS family membrane protein
MTQRTCTWLEGALLGALLLLAAPTIHATSDHPLEPPDRSSPRATMTSFLASVDRAWELYSAGDPAFEEPFRNARECLDLSDVAPLVFDEVSAETALLLKEILDRLELPPMNQIPGPADIEEFGMTQWTVPHTEIQLVLHTEGDHDGQWLFSNATVRRVQEFYERVRDLPYQPGRTGGHIEELRAGSNAVLLIKLTEVMPRWFKTEIGGMFAWHWFGLVLLVVLLVSAVLFIAWLVRRWQSGGWPGHRIAGFAVPLATICVPFVGRWMIGRIFQLPGPPALMLRLLFSVVGYIGLAWLMAVLITRIGELTVKLWFRDSRPLKKQLVRVIFRIAAIVVVTVVSLMALQTLGVPVAGLIAGLGVGGLAIALAAQSTLENFIGGIILYADQPVRVGDVCKFGDRRGTVEDVGLRSVRVRTIDDTVVTIPNSTFAKMQLENLSERERILLRENIRLRYETTGEQLRIVLSEIESMLQEHEQIAEAPLRVRLTGFGEYSLKVELFAYALTDAWPMFLEVREDVLMKVMEIVEHSGTRLALPTEVHYSADEPPLKDQER